eukprot:747410-Hanusia_phi.AAC.4
MFHVLVVGPLPRILLLPLPPLPVARSRSSSMHARTRGRRSRSSGPSRCCKGSCAKVPYPQVSWSVRIPPCSSSPPPRKFRAARILVSSKSTSNLVLTSPHTVDGTSHLQSGRGSDELTCYLLIKSSQHISHLRFFSIKCSGSFLQTLHLSHSLDLVVVRQLSSQAIDLYGPVREKIARGN